MRKDTRTFLLAVLGIPGILGFSSYIHAANDDSTVTYEKPYVVDTLPKVKEVTIPVPASTPTPVERPRPVPVSTPVPTQVVPVATPTPSPVPAPVEVVVAPTPAPAPTPKPVVKKSRRTRAS